MAHRTLDGSPPPRSLRGSGVLISDVCCMAQAAIVVYDVTNSDTFGRAKNWVKELQRQANPNIVIALAGNKADLAAKRQVETSVGSPLAHPPTHRGASVRIAPLRPPPSPCCLFGEAAWNKRDREARKGFWRREGRGYSDVFFSFVCPAGGSGIRRRQWSALHGDVRKDGHERERDFYGHW